jgi:hypothetical protein
VTLASFSRYSKRAGRHVRHVSPKGKELAPLNGCASGVFLAEITSLEFAEPLTAYHILTINAQANRHREMG